VQSVNNQKKTVYGKTAQASRGLVRCRSEQDSRDAIRVLKLKVGFSKTKTRGRINKGVYSRPLSSPALLSEERREFHGYLEKRKSLSLDMLFEGFCVARV
jgi:hypothetical protein